MKKKVLTLERILVSQTIFVKIDKGCQLLLDVLVTINQDHRAGGKKSLSIKHFPTLNKLWMRYREAKWSDSLQND